jgi:hypothetical protein
LDVVAAAADGAAFGPVCSCRIQPEISTTTSPSASVTVSHFARSFRTHCVPAPRPVAVAEGDGRPEAEGEPVADADPEADIAAVAERTVADTPPERLALRVAPELDADAERADNDADAEGV